MTSLSLPTHIERRRRFLHVHIVLLSLSLYESNYSTEQYESYFDHTYHPQKSSLTWTLDYDKTSDFRDVAGHWHVASKTPEGQIEGAVTRVFYACDIRLAGHPPKAIVNYISKAALKQATAWVKRESEAHPDETIPAAYGGSKSGHAAAHADDREPELVGAGTTRRGFWKRRQ